MAEREKNLEILISDKLNELEDQVINLIDEKNNELEDFKEETAEMGLNKKCQDNIVNLIGNNKRLLGVAEEILGDREKIGSKIKENVLNIPKKVVQNKNFEDIVRNKMQETIGREFINKVKNIKHVEIQGCGCCHPLPDCPQDISEKRLVCGTCVSEFPGSFIPIPVNKRFTFFKNNLDCCVDKCLTECTIPGVDNCEVPVKVGRAVGSIDYGFVGNDIFTWNPVCCSDSVCVNQPVCIKCHGDPCPNRFIKIICKRVFLDNIIISCNKTVLIFKVIFILKCC